MCSLNRDQQEVIFEHSLGIADDQLADKAIALIADSREAAEIHSKLKATLAPLDSIRDHTCPYDLVERTVWRLRQMANAEQAARKPLDMNSRSWRNFIQVGAIAAAIFLTVAILIPSFSFARHIHHKHICQRQLACIGDSIGQYCADYDGKLPAVTTDLSQPWCNSNDHGQESCSNSSNLYLLLKHSYHQCLQDFVCPGRREKQVTPLTASEINHYDDFPGREHIGYSFRVFCHPEITMSMLSEQPLLSDRNPVFESVHNDKSVYKLDDELSRRNSMNHNLRGQNVLFTGGQVGFLKTRLWGIPQDDFYTVQNVNEYRGNERPTCEKDSFLAP